MARLGRYRRTEVLVGLFSLIGTLILVLGLLWLRDFRFSRRYNVYESVFPGTGGLLVGDPVMVSGLRKGKVRSMQLLDQGVRVEVAVEQDVRLRRDARAIIVTRGLLGERYVEIDRGKAVDTLPPGSVLRSDVQIGMAELMASTGELVESARVVSDDVRKILQALSGAVDDKQLEGGLRDATAVVRDLRSTLQASRPDLEASVHNFRVASESMARMTSGSEDDVVDVTANLRSTVAQLDTLVAQLQLVASKTDRVADRLLEENSTFGKVVSDRELYDRLLMVSIRAVSLISEIKDNPKRFFNFSLF
jgi:phospholipid/cholesterol/gamma-HCH transport system substrate-binding protein